MIDELKKYIDETTNQTVIKLKRSGLMRENKRSSFKKTEDLLKNYNKYKLAVKSDPDNTIKTKKLLHIIDNALDDIVDDPYCDVINMFYFESKTREQIAEFYNVEVKTITRNKNRLVNDLKIILFSDRTIEELFL